MRRLRRAGPTLTVADRATNRYVKTLHAALYHPKFVGDPERGVPPLTAAEHGTYRVAQLVGDIAYPDAVHEGAVRVLCPGATFDALYERRLLDRCEQPGWFRVHDLEDFHVMPSAMPEAVRDRVQKHRDRRREHVTDVTDVTDVTVTEPNRDETTNTSSVLVGGHRARPRASAGGPKVTGMSRPFEVVG